MRIEPPATILVTGAAGFIGFHTAQELCRRGFSVVGLDNLSDYYDVQLKRDRLAQLEGQPGFQFQLGDISDHADVQSVFAQHQFDLVVHLAAQAGVRYSIDHPDIYIQSNIVGTANLLEAARHAGVKHFAYASSSSVYGMNPKAPFSESDPVDHPISLYAATKKTNELLAHTYSHLFGMPTTGLRFFTVYGPWGRPDMALFKFTQSILEGKPIDVYNHGRMKRDFTYVDDIVQGTVEAALRPGSGSDLYRIFNVGNHQSVELLRFIEVLEEALGKKAELNLLPLQAGDVLETYADIERLGQAVGYHPTTPIEVGIPKFVEWYRDYYKA